MKKWLFLLRAFFPSWKFFAQAGTELQLQVRLLGPEDRASDWQHALPPIPRSLFGLFVNAEAGFLHACHNHLSHFYSDLESKTHGDLASLPEIEGLSSYRITQNMVLFQLQSSKPIPGFSFYQFRLLAWQPQTRQHETILESPIYPMEIM